MKNINQPGLEVLDISETAQQLQTSLQLMLTVHFLVRARERKVFTIKYCSSSHGHKSKDHLQHRGWGGYFKDIYAMITKLKGYRLLHKMYPLTKRGKKSFPSSVNFCLMELKSSCLYSNFLCCVKFHILHTNQPQSFLTRQCISFLMMLDQLQGNASSLLAQIYVP